MSRVHIQQLICRAVDIPRLTMEHFDKIGKEKQRVLSKKRLYYDKRTKPIIKHQHDAIQGLRTRDAILASRDAFVMYVNYQRDCIKIEERVANEKRKAFEALKDQWSKVGELYEFLLEATKEENFTEYMEKTRIREAARTLLELK